MCKEDNPKPQKKVVNESFSYEDVEQDINFIDQFLGDQDGDDDN